MLQASAVVAGGALCLHNGLRAAGPQRRGNGTRVVVALFQRGGADALNLYAPTGDPDYAVLRPNIGLGAPGSAAAVEGLSMDAMFSMHPAMTGLHASFAQANSRCAVVPAVGYQPYSRSHFASQDLYETTLLGSGAEGWINRHLQATAAPGEAPVRALALRKVLPRSMVGSHACYAVQSTRDLAFAGTSEQRVFAEAIAAGTPTGAMAPQRQLAYRTQRETFALLDLFAALDPVNYVPSNGAVYPEGRLGEALREVAEVIKGNLGVEFFAVDQGGWDHHSNLVPRIDANAAEYSAAIAAFFVDLGGLADDVVLVSMSEFGRSAAENGSLGTDHGAGGAMAVVGGAGTAVQGGQVHGTWPGLSPSALLQGKHVAPSNDFRDVLREVLDVHMGGTDPNLVFPSHVFQPIGVL
ncbi:MAG: DUF1501 domain-containing protein [Planctomycetota bacterium]